MSYNISPHFQMMLWADGQQHLTPACPLLAPLLDRMTTDDITKRFTASEALSFCRFIRNSLTLEELGKKLPGRPIGISSADSFPESSTGIRSGTSGSACSESGTDNGSTLLVSPFLELTDIKQSERWKSLPVHFVAKWSIGGNGWVRIIGYLLCFVLLTVNARSKWMNFRKDIVLPLSAKCGGSG